MAADVAVIVPTMRRPDSLARALASLMGQTGVADRLREIVVVDNDPQGTARAAVERLAANAPVPLVYRHEPRPGVATARNSGLSATTAPLIAFLDDDEAADSTWLSALLAAQARTDAAVVFGPIRGQAPDAAPWTRAYLERFFGREGPVQTGPIDHHYGCGNSLMVRSLALPGPAPFDAGQDHSGGEDDLLFEALRRRGGTFAFAADAWVDEFAPAHRATMRYALQRAFAYGQSPSQTAARERRWAGVVKWMAVGAVQTALWGVAALAATLVGHPKRPEAYDRVARGLGKIFWFGGFEPQFYGARELARLDRLATA